MHVCPVTLGDGRWPLSWDPHPFTEAALSGEVGSWRQRRSCGYVQERPLEMVGCEDEGSTDMVAGEPLHLAPGLLNLCSTYVGVCLCTADP